MSLESAAEAVLVGKTAIVTGAAGGLGLQMAWGLARQGAMLVLLDRNRAAGEQAAADIRSEIPDSAARFVEIDLGSAQAIRRFTDACEAQQMKIDLLVNNAGLLPPFKRAETADGYELGFGVSVVGHYVLTGLLLPALHRSPAPRVVTLSSIEHARGHLPFDDLHLRQHYDSTRAYGTAKLAALMMALELQRRATAANSPLLSLAAHPGVSRTGIGLDWSQTKPTSWRDRFAPFAQRLAMRYFGQSAEAGALPTLMACTAPIREGGLFFGPSGFGQLRGKPRVVEPVPRARDTAAASRLWQWLEAQTGLRYAWPA
jgi:NAD(P)-dependent dehydrogenase (short-subunit alcohol dehydrogenase family)